jgi:ATPase subunit of ABC transporter with duplicated ATPase domains
MHASLVEINNLSVETAEGRPLFRELSLRLGREKVALVGRNGVGKTTLLRILAGEAEASPGALVSRTAPVFVRQDPTAEESAAALAWLLAREAEDPSLARELAPVGLPPLAALVGARHSRGEARKLLLLAAKLSRGELLLLDEPTEGLDEAGLAWLCAWLQAWDRGAIVVSHHRGLLRRFDDFFVVAEAGCSHVSGGLAALERRLAEEGEARERQYVRNLNALDAEERRDETIRRRRERKKNVGRLHELDRCTSRMRLNMKRSHAQVTQARAARVREDRIAATRAWARATRRALAVTLPLELAVPELAEADGRPAVTLADVGVRIGERSLFAGVDLGLQRERLAIVGPNGAGKTTLLNVMSGARRPTSGAASRRSERIGTITQGASDWIADDSLVERLQEQSHGSLADVAALLMTHRFPLALAERPLRSLSPGERVRAALICLFNKTPTVELLILDEPSDGLDLVGVAALQRALRAWPGGLVIASHDRELLDGVGVDRVLELDGRGGHRLV